MRSTDTYRACSATMEEPGRRRVQTAIQKYHRQENIRNMSRLDKVVCVNNELRKPMKLYRATNS
ncbi:hypothetical protein CHS0354_024931 [Potamilus streckersoni]|uniref:Uncharacterized protein n=1 Tax=Potamilus streckersoni TaxID=2493646 RepID=A0AAE0S4K9_9BIVA|nr:hypothetical protein CHS0354_024931 [Potamilus streckersoni]